MAAIITILIKTAAKFDGWRNLRYHDVAGWSSLVARWAHNAHSAGNHK